ncbi:hypothetical protein Ct61P_15114 [Colletotrichum tofieldiae]|nr:hypothetical protein Ct61P_15114 [Colletotrichum tofieldiae]
MVMRDSAPACAGELSTLGKGKTELGEAKTGGRFRALTETAEHFGFSYDTMVLRTSIVILVVVNDAVTGATVEGDMTFVLQHYPSRIARLDIPVLFPLKPVVSRLQVM